MIRKVFLPIVAAGAALPRAVRAAQATSLKIACIPADIAAECWYASDLGYFAAEGISTEITPIPSGPAIAAAVASGAVNIGYSNVLTLAIAHQRGIPFRIIAPANLNIASAPTAGLLAVRADARIFGAKDLEEKTVGVAGLDNIAYFAVRSWADVHGADSNKIRFVEIPLPELAAALRAGRVDAAPLDALSDPNLGKPGNPLRLLAASFNAISPNFLLSGWFATTRWVDANPDLARRFAAAIRKAAVWGNAHHQESAAVLARHTKLGIEQIERTTRVTYGSVLNASLIQPNVNVGLRYHVLQGGFSVSELL
jgi:NitT/TauT family transport system substrate-binding protein